MRHPVRAEINVTPLVDVCLVLLIIFMVPPSIEEIERPGFPRRPLRDVFLLRRPGRVRTTDSASADNDPGPLSEAAFEELVRALHSQNPNRNGVGISLANQTRPANDPGSRIRESGAGVEAERLSPRGSRDNRNSASSER